MAPLNDSAAYQAAVRLLNFLCSSSAVIENGQSTISSSVSNIPSAIRYNTNYRYVSHDRKTD